MSKNVMSLDSILADLDEGYTKVAEEECDSKEGKKEDGKEAILKALSGKDAKEPAKEKADDKGEEKAASAPAEDLQKIANEVIASEEEALVKEAQLYGASVADGFMARISMYEKVAEDLGPQKQSLPLSSLVKQASEQMYHDDEGNLYTESEVRAVQREMEQEKLASYQGYNQFSPGYINNEQFDIEPEAVKLAEELIEDASARGYQMSGQEALEKVAEQAYQAGYNDVMEKAASDAHARGYNETLEKAAELAYNEGFETTLEKAAELLREAGQGEAVEALEKAAFESGYEDTMEKIAASAFEQGAADMDNIIQQLA
jgi:hypothetical protein